MGFGSVRRNNGSTIWANFNAKTGLFQIGNKDNRVEHEALQNVLVRRVMIMENPNYDDKSVMDKLVAISARMEDGNDAVVKFSLTHFAVKVLGLLRSADLSQPIDLVGGSFAEGTIDKNQQTGEEKVREEAQPFLVGYQNGEKLKATFSDDPEFKIPKVEVIEVNNPSTGVLISKVKDPTLRNEFILNFAKEMAIKVEAAAKSHPNIAPPSNTERPAPDHTDADDESALSHADILGEADAGASDADQFRPAA